MFVGRKEELNQLEKLYQAEQSNMLVFYGRSSIGKTAMIQHFIADKEGIYYQARECSDREQLLQMKSEFKENFDISEDCINICDLVSSVIRQKKLETSSKKIVFILDEFQLIAVNDKGLKELLSHFIDKKSEFGSIMVILISSSVNFVEHGMVEQLGAASQLITDYMKLSELGFADLVEWFPESSVEDCIYINAVLGGVPKYLEYWNGTKTIKDNILHLILSRNSVLFPEAERILKLELRELSSYNTILAALSEGKNKLNEIHLRTGFERAKISVYLKNLIQMDLVEKVFSYDAKNKNQTKKGLYRIKDNFLNFWYRFLFRHQSAISAGRGEWVYEEKVLTEFPDYMREYFAQVCSEYLKLMSEYGRLPYHYNQWGIWYGKSGVLDVVASKNGADVLTALCLWSDEQMQADALNKMQMLVELAGLKSETMFLFSKSGFTDSLQEFVKQEKQIHLVSLSDL